MCTTVGEREQNMKNGLTFSKIGRLNEDYREGNRDHKFQEHPTRTRHRWINVSFKVHTSTPTAGEGIGGPCQCSN